MKRTQKVFSLIELLIVVAKQLKTRRPAWIIGVRDNCSPNMKNRTFEDGSGVWKDRRRTGANKGLRIRVERTEHKRAASIGRDCRKTRLTID